MSAAANPPSLTIPVPIEAIPGLLKGVDSTAGKYFKDLLMAEIERNLQRIAKPKERL